MGGIFDRICTELGGAYLGQAYLKSEVEDMIATADRNYRPAPGTPDTLRLPLIRLRVQVPKDQVRKFWLRLRGVAVHILEANLG